MDLWAAGVIPPPMIGKDFLQATLFPMEDTVGLDGQGGGMKNILQGMKISIFLLPMI